MRWQFFLSVLTTLLCDTTRYGWLLYDMYLFLSVCNFRRRVFESKHIENYSNTLLYFVSSRERPWRHWARPRTHAARRILFLRQSRCSFLNVWDNTQVARPMTSVFTRNTRWRHSHSRGETKCSNIVLETSNLVKWIMEGKKTTWICIIFI